MSYSAENTAGYLHLMSYSAENTAGYLRLMSYSAENTAGSIVDAQGVPRGYHFLLSCRLLVLAILCATGEPNLFILLVSQDFHF